MADVVHYKLIKRSPFANQYGVLDLVEDDEGKSFLRMGDCFGPDFFGPLTDNEIQAFHLLCSVTRS